LLNEGTAVTTTMAETDVVIDVVTEVVVTGGVDTHLDTNMAAALDGVGGQLGVREFPTTPPATASCWGGSPASAP
jgi:hypothetical protein